MPVYLYLTDTNFSVVAIVGVEFLMKNMFIYALTAKERIETLRKKHMFLETDKIFLDRWHNIQGLSSIDDLESLLNSQGLSLDEFAYVIKPLSRADEKTLEKSLDYHNWYIEIERILNDYFMNANKLEQELSLDISYIIRPFLNDFSIFFENLKNKFDQKSLKIANDVVKKMMQHVTMILSNIIIKVVAIDKNEDDSEETNENYFEKKYGSQELLNQFYTEYPVMTRLIVEKLTMLKEFIKKSFLSLIEYSEEIKEKFNFTITGNVMTNVELEVDDEGQENVIYTFRGDKKLVYKHKNFEIEQCFYKFVNWMNCQMDKHPELLNLPLSVAIYQENLTLSPFIRNCLPESKNEKKDYYKRLGQLSAILYLLGAHNLIYENIVINQGIFYINSETLFQLDVGLLETNTEVETKSSDLPILPSLEEDEWIGDFKQGLRIMSDFILNNKDNITLKIRECFTSKVKVRQHLKDVAHYYRLMQFLNHPNYLKDMFYLEKLFDNTLAYPYKDKRVCAFEIDLMRQGVVPSFYTELGNQDVLLSNDKRIVNYFEQKPLEQVINRIEALNASKMEKYVLSMISNLQIFAKK